MKKFFSNIHLWLSIPFGIIIATICLTGAILVFETEILQLCYPSRYFVKEVKGSPQPPDVLIKAARQQLPDSIRINGIRAYSDPERTWQIIVPGKKTACFIDPYTAEITGFDSGQGFFMKTMRIHRWLLDEYKRDGSFSWGKTLTGYATLALAVILISGLVIWFPRSRKALKNRLKVKTGSGGFRLLHDLHVSGGFYAALLLLAISLTGLTWSFGWYRNLFYAAFGVSGNLPSAHAPITAAKPSGEKAGKDKDKKEGKDGKSEGNGHAAPSDRKGKPQQKTTDYTHWAEVLTDLQNRHPEYKSITLQDGSASVSTGRYGNTIGSDRYAFDPATGEIIKAQLYKDLPKSGKIRGWVYSVHIGSWGGMTTRILSCLASLFGAVLVITGYYLWIKKRF